MAPRPAPSRAARVAVALARGLILGYRYGVSPLLGPRCRFWPSCSEYGLQAFERAGPVRGAWLTARRLVRCHPWNPGGIDLPPGDEPDAPAPGRYLGRALREPGPAPTGARLPSPRQS
ncbi:MAG TPA: membrane protein insertion efficiency factor YidD [Burkholderiaceae bacterium]|nr:membrane protein insertion efficiency factor YidD [Burkholderiaceae bacterium]